MGGDGGDFYIEELEELELELDATPAPAPSVDDRRRLARQLAETKKAAAKSLADRAPRPKTAAELMAEAFRQERQAKEDAVAAVKRQEEEALEAKRRLAAEARAKAEEAKRRAEAQAEADREAARRAEEDRAAFAALSKGPPRPTSAPPRRPVRRPPPAAAGGMPKPGPAATDPMGLMLAEGRVERMLERIGTGFTVHEVFVDVPLSVVGPLWESHVVRALHDGDLASAVAADNVRSLIVARPTDLAAARVGFKGQEWAVWVDLDDDRILAAMSPAAVYLVGLG